MSEIETNILNVPSDTVLDEISVRGLKFFSAVSTNAYIRAALDQRGYSDAVHEKAWALVLEASGYQKPGAAALTRPEAAKAIAEVDAWDEPNFRIARATLVDMPEQQSFVFADLEAQKGAASIVSVTTFLDRLDELENGKERKATRKADHAALARLEERRIGKAERARLRTLLETATTSPAAPAGAAPTPQPDAEKRATQRAAKIALWKLHFEWSEIAKADIKRRDHLILLGLATRKKKEKKEAGGNK